MSDKKETESKKMTLQGPRPPRLKICQESHAEMKQKGKKKEPVIIHLKSPEIIHAPPKEFMALVQRLTGRPRESSAPPPPSCFDSIAESSSEKVADCAATAVEGANELCDFSSLLLPALLQDMPLFTPNQQDSLLFSPMKHFYMLSEPLFTCPASVPDHPS